MVRISDIVDPSDITTRMDSRNPPCWPGTLPNSASATTSNRFDRPRDDVADLGFFQHVETAEEARGAIAERHGPDLNRTRGCDRNRAPRGDLVRRRTITPVAVPPARLGGRR